MSFIDDIIATLQTDWNKLTTNQLLQGILAQLQIQNKAIGAPAYYLSAPLVLNTSYTTETQIVQVSMPPVGTPYLDTIAIGFDSNASQYFSWRMTIDGVTDLNGNSKQFYSFTNEINPFVNKNLPLPVGAKITLYATCTTTLNAVNGTVVLYVLANVIGKSSG